MTSGQLSAIMVEKADFERLEQKVDELMQALAKLILIDERQINQGQRMGHLEQSVAGNFNSLKTLIDKNYEAQNLLIERVDKKVDKWINMGIGGWAVVSTLLLLYQLFGHLVIK